MPEPSRRMPKELRDLQVEAARRQLQGLPINLVLEKLRQIVKPETNASLALAKLQRAEGQDQIDEALRMGRIKVIPFRSTM